MFRLEVVVLIASAFILSCDARSDGAPKSACAAMTPIHHGISVQRTDPAYSVSAVRNGDKIRVKISSPVGEEFQGFVLQARSGKDRSRMIDGTFTQTNGVSKTIDCFKGTQNTLTHISPSTKREVVTDFTPSNGVSGDIVFRATVAKTFALFWTEIDSPVLRIGGGATSNKQQGKDESDSNRMYHNCFTTKGCFGMPTGCIDRRDCEVFLSYAAAPDGIAFKISGFLETQNYIAMGLSSDNKMGDDHVTECVRDGSNVVVRQSWNEGGRKKNSQTREFPRDRYSSDFINGLTTCSWTANFLIESNGRRFDLENSTYYLLLARGPMENEFIGYHSAKIATQEAVNFTAFEQIEGEGVTDSVKIHGKTEVKSIDVSEDSFVTTEKIIESVHSNSNYLRISILCVLVCLGLKIVTQNLNF